MSVSIHDIAIIGSGNVANFIAHILSEKGFNISQVHSRNSITGKNLACKIKSEFIEEITAVTAEIIFIAVHDQQIEKSIAKLPKSSILFYTSGTVDLASISAENCGYRTKRYQNNMSRRLVVLLNAYWENELGI